MTTPQNPGDAPDSSEGPQDPADPQNPYAPPPSDPPTTAIPPAPPVFGTGDPGQPAYGQPTYGQPAYGQPSNPGYPAPAAPPPAPGYGQPYPQYAAPGSEQPGKGMAIAALIISFFGCVVLGALIAIPMAIVVLVRSRGGVNRGKGLAIAAILVSLLTLAIPVGLLAAGYTYVSSLTDVGDLEPGDCITADGLTDAKAESVTEIKTVSCSEKHDGEVLATVDLTADQAKNYSTTPISEICAPAIEAAGKTGVLTDAVVYTALTEEDPEAGDQAACVAYHADGSKLTGRLPG